MLGRIARFVVTEFHGFVGVGVEITDAYFGGPFRKPTFRAWEACQDCLSSIFIDLEAWVLRLIENECSEAWRLDFYLFPSIGGLGAKMASERFGGPA